MFIDPPLHIRPLAQPVFLDHPNAKASVLLIHGFADSPYSMRAFGAFFHEAGYRVLLMRLPGHGSRLEDLAQATLTDWQEAVRRSLAQLHGYREPVVIVGRSFGGVLALLAVAENPDAAQALIAIATPNLKPSQRFLRPFLPLLGKLRGSIQKPWMKPEERVMRLEVGRYTAFPIPALMQFFHSLDLLNPQLLQTIHTPALVIHGADDIIADPNAAKQIVSALGSAHKQLLLLPGVGHAPETILAHADLRSAIMRFLAKELTQIRTA